MSAGRAAWAGERRAAQARCRVRDLVVVLQEVDELPRRQVEPRSAASLLLPGVTLPLEQAPVLGRRDELLSGAVVIRIIRLVPTSQRDHRRVVEVVVVKPVEAEPAGRRGPDHLHLLRLILSDDDGLSNIYYCLCNDLIKHYCLNYSKILVVLYFSIILLLDTNLPENEERFRDITAHVYGGDSTTRISQEVLLGIGGVRMLRAIGIKPSVYHMNEGHSAFLTLELLREEITKGVAKEKAMQNVTKQCIFTTHTPVPAGHDRFNQDLMTYIFGEKAKNFGMTMDELMTFGREHPDDGHSQFCMTVLALKLSRTANGVSELHGHVSREMWNFMYPEKSVDKVPIGYVTNGIHVSSWLHEKTQSFWNEKLGTEWREHYLEPKFWEKAVDPKNVSDEELWALRYTLRRKLVEFSRFRLHEQHSRYGNGADVYNTILNPDALTICFARRFATYKRAPLLFTHFEKILSLFNDTRRPFQIIFAGKAHPRDDEGKKFIQKIIEITKHPNLFGKVVFVENYDMNVARYLTSGADVWLNNPRRPLEASGTSGQKISINGGLNCSIMDGWWREAYDGHNGWSIGGDEQPADAHVQDTQDSQFLYEVLSQQIIPEFYDRDANGIPKKWIKRMRHAIATLVPQYSTHRMVAEYVKKYYL